MMDVDQYIEQNGKDFFACSYDPPSWESPSSWSLNVYGYVNLFPLRDCQPDAAIISKLNCVSEAMEMLKKHLSPEDIEKVEAEMNKILKEKTG
jgi:hypothetical protein